MPTAALRRRGGERRRGDRRDACGGGACAHPVGRRGCAAGAPRAVSAHDLDGALGALAGVRRALEQPHAKCEVRLREAPFVMLLTAEATEPTLASSSTRSSARVDDEVHEHARAAGGGRPRSCARRALNARRRHRSRRRPSRRPCRRPKPRRRRLRASTPRTGCAAVDRSLSPRRHASASPQRGERRRARAAGAFLAASRGGAACRNGSGSRSSIAARARLEATLAQAGVPLDTGAGGVRDHPEAGWPATPQCRSAPPQEPGSPWPDSPPLGRSGSAAVHLRGPRFSEHREQLGLD